MALGSRRRTAGAINLAWLLAGTVFASGCQTLGLTARASPANAGDRNCYGAVYPGVDVNFASLDPGRLEAIARGCALAAGETDSVRQRTAALFHAGRANLELGKYHRDHRSDPPLGLGLATAADQLDLVVRATNYTVAAIESSSKKAKAKASDADIPAAARLALARVYKLQGRYPEAIRTLEAMLAAAPNQPNAAAKLELARVYLDRSKDGAVADGSLEKAVGYLEVFASDLTAEDPALVQEGRLELINRASQLGLAMMSGPPSRESSQRAIDALAKAEAGAVAAGASVPAGAVADIYMKLGQAKLRMAGLPTIQAPTVFQCDAQGDSFWLGEAQKSFTLALGKAADNAEANAGMGCARQAIAYQTSAPPVDAIPWFEQAVKLQPTQIRYWLSYANVLGASGRDATPAFQQALALAGADMVQAARIHVEIAKIYLHGGQIDAAIASAKDALAADKTNGGAHLVLGKALYESRAGAAKNAYLAKAELDQAVMLTKLRAEQKDDYAEALYYRSLLEMDPPTVQARAAVRDAIDAANSADRPAYKEQACLATVRFLDATLVADGKIRCSVEDSPDANVFAKASLLEGMFYLATTRVPGIDKDKGREYALKSFDKGLGRLGDSSPGEDIPTKSLRAKLTVGRAIAYSCVGLRETGLAIMRDVDVTYQGEADQYFTTYHVKACQR
jgi:tetratricopeptide (TPR) repeat protein